MNDGIIGYLIGLLIGSLIGAFILGTAMSSLDQQNLEKVAKCVEAGNTATACVMYVGTGDAR